MPPPISTYQQRNTASRLPALPPLAPGALTYTPGKPQFSDLAAQTLGNAGTSADGFDALFTSVASIVDADIASLAVFDALAVAGGFVDGAVSAILLEPIAHEYSAFLAVGDADMGSVDDGNGQGGPPAGCH